MPLDAARVAMREGVAAFRSGDVDRSLERFDRVYVATPKLRPYLWQ
jgi:hypothetical protein